MEQRVNVAMLNPDRADVIVPAGHIYLSAMEWAGVNNMLVPDIGLKDGMLQTLFEDFFDELNSTPQAGHPAQVPVPDLQNQPAELE
jgi:exopolyphosphatase/guanosine-5'-triphosphate,3'-diphosphate pyrophosphatase